MTPLDQVQRRKMLTVQCSVSTCQMGWGSLQRAPLMSRSNWFSSIVRDFYKIVLFSLISHGIEEVSTSIWFWQDSDCWRWLSVSGSGQISMQIPVSDLIFRDSHSTNVAPSPALASLMSPAVQWQVWIFCLKAEFWKLKIGDNFENWVTFMLPGT